MGKVVAVRGAPSLGGTVTRGAGIPVAGQEVELRSGAGFATVVRTVTSDGSGVWRMDGVPLGSYQLRLQPSDRYQCVSPAFLGVGQEGVWEFVVDSNAPATNLDFTVESPPFFDDFQGYPNSAALIGSLSNPDQITTAGAFGATALTYGYQRPASPSLANGEIRLTTDGPGGSQVMRYNFPDRLSVGCVSNGFKVHRAVHFNSPYPTDGFLATRYYTRARLAHTYDDPGSLFHGLNFASWVPGLAGCGTIEYKHLLQNVRLSAGGNAEFALLDYGTPPGQVNMNAFGWSNAQNSPSDRWPIPAVGDWHSWVYIGRNFDTSACVTELWYDGVRVNTMTPGIHYQGGVTKNFDFVDLGANINTGNPLMAKEWRAFGIYTKRCREKATLLA